MKSIAYIVGFICGIVFVAVAALVSKKIGDKKYGKAEKPYYDERQIAIRGKAFRFGFLIYTILELVMMGIYAFNINLPLSGSYIHGIIFFTAFLGFIVYSIWTDAYFQNGEKQGTWVIIIVFAILINIFAAIMPKIRGKNISLANLLITIFLIIILVNVWAKKIADNKSEKEE